MKDSFEKVLRELRLAVSHFQGELDSITQMIDNIEYDLTRDEREANWTPIMRDTTKPLDKNLKILGPEAHLNKPDSEND